MRLIILGLLWLALAGCGQPEPAKASLPMLQLSPHSLGQTLSLVQRLTVQQLPAGADTRVAADSRTLEAQLEVDPDKLQLAAFALGQRVLLLDWNGQSLNVKRHPLLPAEVDATRVLRDIQFTLWPLAAIRASLPEGWTCEDSELDRTLYQHGEAKLIAHFSAPRTLRSRIELENRQEHYRLVIESTEQAET